MAAQKVRNEMNLERRIDLFSLFVDVFDLNFADEQKSFAIACGYGIARDVRLIKDVK